MKRKKKPDVMHKVIFHSLSGCYESEPLGRDRAIRLSMRHRNAIAIVVDDHKHKILWQAPHHSVFLIDRYCHDMVIPLMVRVPSLCGGKWHLQSMYCKLPCDRYKHDPHRGWSCKHYCWSCGVGLPSDGDEVLCLGGIRLCLPCESGVKRTRISVDRGDMNRKWTRFLESLDQQPAFH